MKTRALILVFFIFLVREARGEVRISSYFTEQQKEETLIALQSINQKLPTQLFKIVQALDLEIVPLQNGLSKFLGGSHIVGFNKGKNLYLSDNVFSDSYFESIKEKTRHKSRQVFLEATLVHELSHALDVNSLSKDDQNDLGQNCPSIESHDSSRCQDLRAKKGVFSYNDKFLFMTGWRSQSGRLELINTRKSGSPDVYEFSSPKEAFAVHMEYFVLDSDYSCKKPGVYSVLLDFFGEPPFSNACAGSIGFLILNQKNKANEWVGVPLSRVQAVSYLLASPGESAMSKWGHAMIYLTVCPPDKNPSKDNCDTDISSHLVISPAALTYKGISSLAGLNGSYDFKFFVTPALEVIRDYNLNEMRDLEIYKLERLNTGALKSVLIDFVYNFTEKYYFVSNNCAHGVLSVLGAAGLSNISGKNLTPISLKDSLIQQKVISDKPTKVFKKDLVRLAARDKILKAAALSWAQFIGLPIDKRKEIYSDLVQASRAKLNDVAVLEYLIIVAREEMIISGTQEYISSELRASDTELKEMVQVGSGVSEAIENFDDYGVPSLEFAVSALNFRGIKMKLSGEAKDLIDSFKKKNKNLFSEQEESLKYYKLLLKQIIEKSV